MQCVNAVLTGISTLLLESVFRLFRKCFLAVIGDTVLNSETFRTVLPDICNTLNQRPLITISPDSDILQIFFPSSLLGGCFTPTLTSEEFSHADGLRKSWKSGEIDTNHL